MKTDTVMCTPMKQEYIVRNKHYSVVHLNFGMLYFSNFSLSYVEIFSFGTEMISAAFFLQQNI